MKQAALPLAALCALVTGCGQAADPVRVVPESSYVASSTVDGYAPLEDHELAARAVLSRSVDATRFSMAAYFRDGEGGVLADAMVVRADVPIVVAMNGEIVLDETSVSRGGGRVGLDCGGATETACAGFGDPELALSLRADGSFDGSLTVTVGAEVPRTVVLSFHGSLEAAECIEDELELGTIGTFDCTRLPGASLTVADPAHVPPR